MRQVNVYTKFLSALLAFFILLSPSQANAQVQNCDDTLVEANTLYSTGSFDATIALIDQCLASADITESQRMKAYRLKGLSFIGKGLETDAKETIKSLLQLVPSYEADPVMDPPNFVNMISQLREELDEELAPPANESTNEGPALETVTQPAEAPLEEVQQPPVQEEINDSAAELEQPKPQNESPQASKRKKRGAGKWIIGGLGVAAAGGLAFLLLQDSGTEAIASPPELP